MAVVFDRIFPRKLEDAPPVSQLTKAQIAEALVSRVQAGKSWKVARGEVQSLACGAQTKAVALVDEVAAALKADVQAFRAVNPLEYQTAAEYKAALDAAAKYIPTATYIQYLQDAYDIPEGTGAERFAALKAALTPAES